MNLEECRNSIDQIDAGILELLNLRTAAVLKIGGLKARAGIPVNDPEREAEVLRHVDAANKGPLDSDAARRIFSQILSESRRAQAEVLASSTAGQEATR